MLNSCNLNHITLTGSKISSPFKAIGNNAWPGKRVDRHPGAGI
jgi:hypothetical protein